MRSIYTNTVVDILAHRFSFLDPDLLISFTLFGLWLLFLSFLLV